MSHNDVEVLVFQDAKNLVQSPSVPTSHHPARRLALFRFSLSNRDIEDLLAERGIDVSYETILRWVEKFGGQYAKQLRMKRPKLSTTWHIDEVSLKIAGK